MGVITRLTIADRLAAYLRHDMSLADLVAGWSRLCIWKASLPLKTSRHLGCRGLSWYGRCPRFRVDPGEDWRELPLGYVAHANIVATWRLTPPPPVSLHPGRSRILRTDCESHQRRCSPHDSFSAIWRGEPLSHGNIFSTPASHKSTDKDDRQILSIESPLTEPRELA